MRALSCTLLLAALALCAGCMRNKGIYTTYEERYRLFYLTEQSNPDNLASDAEGQPADPEAAGRTFGAMASLNRGFEELTSEGFQLAKVEPVGDRGGATKFVFRRRIPEWYHPTTGPMELLGIFATQPEDENAKPTYYVLDPLDRGYLVHIVTPEGERELPVHWNGRNLMWREGDDEHSIDLSADGRSIFHRVTTLGRDAVVSADGTVEAVRVMVKR